jgi:hypothetical protein
MSNSFFTKPTQNQLAHIPSSMMDITVHDNVTHFRDESFTSNPLCVWPSQLSIQPRSAVNNAPLSGTIVDFNYSSPDYISRIYANFRITNTSTTVTVNYLSYNTFNRLELLDSNNNIIYTLYANNFAIGRFLTKNKLETDRMSIAENFNSANLGAMPLAPLSVTEINLELPTWVSENVCRTDMIQNGFTFRFYFHDACSDNSTLLTVNNFNLNIFGQKYTSLQSSLDLNLKSGEILRYKYLYPQRAYLNNAYPLQPNQQFNIQLVSGRGLCAFFYMTISNSIFSFTDINKYYPVDRIQFNDASNTIVGIQWSSKGMQSAVSNYKQLPGSILNYNFIQANSLPNIYVFDMSPNIELAKTNTLGFYSLTGLESVQFTMPSTFVAGNYKIEIMCYNYAFAQIKDGVLTATISA